MLELQFGIRKRKHFLKNMPMRKQNYGMLSSKELKWKMISRNKENIKKMKSRELKGKKKEGKEKKERKHLLQLKMLRN
jgi:hypothetical protein